jgi:hypothetical protein
VVHEGDFGIARARAPGEGEGSEGTMKAPRTNDGKNQPLANWVHYVRKRRALGLLPGNHVAALNGIKFQCTSGQSPRGKFEVRFDKLEEFKKTHVTVSFLGEYKRESTSLPLDHFMPKAQPSRCSRKMPLALCLLWSKSRSLSTSVLCLGPFTRTMNTLMTPLVMSFFKVMMSTTMSKS